MAGSTQESILNMKNYFVMLALVVAGSAMAQTAAVPVTAAPTQSLEQINPNDDGRLPKDQLVEHLHTSDSQAILDETRVGGQSQGVTVTNKNRAPNYEVRPIRNDNKAANGQRVWNVLKF